MVVLLRKAKVPVVLLTGSLNKFECFRSLKNTFWGLQRVVLGVDLVKEF